MGDCKSCREPADELEWADEDFTMETPSLELKRHYGYSGYTRPVVLAGQGLCTDCAKNKAVDVAREIEKAAMEALGPDIKKKIEAEAIRTLSDQKPRTLRRIIQKLQPILERKNKAEQHIAIMMLREVLTEITIEVPPRPYDTDYRRQLKEEFLPASAAAGGRLPPIPAPPPGPTAGSVDAFYNHTDRSV